MTTMRRSLKTLAVLALVPILTVCCPTQEPAQVQPSNAIICTDPGDIRAKNSYWGPGGEQHQPKPPVESQQEDLRATNPKFDVRDSAAQNCHVNLGAHAR